jgi:hypothetical protein
MVGCRVEITLVPFSPKVINLKKSSKGTDEEEGVSQQMYSLRFMYDNYLFINHIKLKNSFKMEDYVPPGFLLLEA